jgi:alanine racemase
MTLTAPIVSAREVDAGTAVGYGLRYRTDRRTRLALLPLGYADGIPRALSPDARVLLRGRRVPLAGTVSMDQVVVDAAELGDADLRPGEVATVFGPGDDGEPTLREWAGWAGTIEHELVTRIGPRVRRETAGAPGETTVVRPLRALGHRGAAA